MSSALLDLPPELLLLVLVEAGTQELKTLASVAATCRQLRNIANGEEVLWTILHAQLYDDPTCAGAFLEPQERYDWQTSVIERDWFHTASRAASRAPAHSNPHPLVVNTKRACTVMLGLYLDFPNLAMTDKSRQRPCLNISRLDQLRCPEFAWACEHRVSEGGDTLARLHLLRLVLDEHPWERQERLAARVPKLWECVEEQQLQAPLRPDGTVAWTYLDAVASELLLCKCGTVRTPDEDLDNRSMVDSVSSAMVELNDVRGRGLLGVVADGDWLGVSGTWKCDTYRFDATRVGSWEAGEYDVAPIELDALRQAYAQVSPRAESHLELLESKLPPPTSSLPAVYFIGEGPGLPRDHRGECVGRHFVCGKVRLTADNPPQIVWTWVVENLGKNRGYEDFAMVIEAVQIGGRQSKAGMIGVSP